MPEIYTFIRNIIITALFPTIIGFLLKYISDKIFKKKRIAYCIESKSDYDGDDDVVMNRIRVSKKEREFIGYKTKITKITIWNDGYNTIRKEDFANLGKLSIYFDHNIKIYEISLSPSNKLNDLKFTYNDYKKINIDFDFLKQNDIFVISIKHDREDNKINIGGCIIDDGKICKGNFHIKRLKVLKIIKKRKLYPTHKLVIIYNNVKEILPDKTHE